MKKILTLNEEINRMKSLFNDSRVHGNLNESILLTEQGIGKKLMKALSSVAVVLKGFDPKLLTNFLETEIKNFDDLTRHLNQYDTIWKKIIPSKDFDYVKDMASELSRIQNKGTLGNVSEDLISDTIKNIPKEGGLREAFLDMWLEAQGKSVKNVPDNTQRVVVKDTKTGENILHVKDEAGGIKTYREKSGEMVLVKDYDVNKAGDDFVTGGDNVTTSTISDGDVTGNVKSTSEPINPKGNPDVTQGQMIGLIEKAMELLAKKGETPKPISNKGLEEGITNGGTLVVKGQDGKYYTVEKIDNTIVTIDGDGNIIDIKELGSTNTTPKPDPIETGNNNYGDNKIPPTDTKNMDKSLLGVLRYLFPVTSTGVKFVRWVGGKTSLFPPGFTKDRFTFFPNGSTFDLSDWRFWARLAENKGRLIAEQMFLVYFYGSYKEYQRGESKPFAVDTFWTKKVPAYVFFLKDTVVDGLVDTIDGIIEHFSSAEADNEWCKNYCETEEGIDPSKVTESPCFKKCTTKIEETKKTFEELKKEVEDYSNTLKEIGKLENMDEAEIEKFCSGADGKKLKLTNSITKMKKGILTFEESIEKQKEDNQVVGFLIEYAGLGDESTMDDVLEKVLTPPGEKEKISVSQLEDIQKQIDQRCIDWYNKDDYTDPPMNNDGPIIDEPIDDNDKTVDEKKDMVYLNMSIIPIEIVGDEES